jgi:rhodanese-related sulfurtransferase
LHFTTNSKQSLKFHKVENAFTFNAYLLNPLKLVDVLNGHFDNQIDEFIIIDSRYPYEFEGGHITNALNIYNRETIYSEMFLKRLNFKNSNLHRLPTSASNSCLSNLQVVSETSQQANGMLNHAHSTSTACLSQMDTDQCEIEKNLFSSPLQLNGHHGSGGDGCGGGIYDGGDSSSNSTAAATSATSSDIDKRVIVIFHCEFSSERGPSLLRFLRSQDRSLNEKCYPNLYYPELYLLEGGYKSFYESFKVTSRRF